MHRRLRSVSALALGLLGVACPSGSAAKPEAAAVSRAVTALREADNQKKPELLLALRETECSVEDICAVRSACLAAYELHVTTLARVIAGVTGLDGGNHDASSVDALKQDLARARELGDKCTDAQGEMIRRYKL